MSGTATGSGLVLNSGRCVPYLCYADDVVLLSDTSLGLQILIDSMHGFCVNVCLTISFAKTEIVVFNGAGIQDSWSLHGLALPRFSSVNYHGLNFHESGSLGRILRHLHFAGQVLGPSFRPDSQAGLHVVCAYAAQACIGCSCRLIWL